MKISLCLITKNEEKNIKKCIDSVKSAVNEIVVVDTGSEDKTVEIAKSLKAKVYYFKWVNDFAAARNYALKKAHGDWIIFLDADEYFTNESEKYIKMAIEQAEENQCNLVTSELINIDKDTEKFQSSTITVRIFKYDPELKYVGKIHERLSDEKVKLKTMIANNELKIIHTGYSNSIVNEKNKLDRNLKLLYDEYDKNPNDSNICFYLVESLRWKGNNNEVLKFCERVFENNNATLIGVYQKAYCHQLEAMINLNLAEDNIIELYNKASEYDKSYPDYDGKMMEYYINQKEYEKAISYSEKCIEKMNSYNSSIESWIISAAKNVFIKLADLYYLTDQKDKAVKTLVDIVKIYKDEEVSLGNLMKLLLESEGIENIYNFLGKIYNFDDVKDRLTLIRGAIKTENVDLCKYFCEQLNEN